MSPGFAGQSKSITDSILVYNFRLAMLAITLPKTFLTVTFSLYFCNLASAIDMQLCANQFPASIFVFNLVMWNLSSVPSTVFFTVFFTVLANKYLNPISFN